MSSYVKVLDAVILSGTPTVEHASDPTQGVLAFELASGRPEIGVVFDFVAGSAASYPAYHLYWRVPGVGWIRESLRDENAELEADGKSAIISDYDLAIHCRDLTGSAGTDPKGRTHDVFPGATHLLIRPFEGGDTGNPGVATVYIGRPA